MSYGNNISEIHLQRTTPVLITGINHDASVNGELDSNGAGKSTILMAITFALYDVAAGKETDKKDNLINNINKKDMLVELSFSVGKDNYTVTRYRKNKSMGGTGVKIEKNKKDITPDSIANANKYIAEQILKIPYEIFSRIITYSANDQSFLSLPLAKQRDVIEELFSYTELTEKAEILKEKIKSNKIDLEYAVKTNEEIVKEYEDHERALIEAETNFLTWEEKVKKEMEEVEETINLLGSIDFDREEKVLEEIEASSRQIEAIESQISLYQRDLRRLEEEQLRFKSYSESKEKRLSEIKNSLKEYTKYSNDELEAQIKLLEELERLKKESLDMMDNYESMKKNRKLDEGRLQDLKEQKKIREDSKCPTCLQTYVGEKAASELEELKQQIDDLVKQLDNAKKQETGVLSSLIEYTKQIEKLSDTIIFESLESVQSYIRDRDDMLNQLNTLESEQNPYVDKSDEIVELKNKISVEQEKLKGITIGTSKFENIKELFSMRNKFEQAVEKKALMEKQENPYAAMLESLKNVKLKKDKTEEIEKLRDDIKHQEFLLKLLTKKDSFIRKALMDKFLPFLNERLHQYLKTMGLPHAVSFTSDLSVDIRQFDQSINFMGLSSGQKARINIALSLAFRDLLQAKHNFINLYILDECLDVGLSNVGIKKTVKLIKDVAERYKLSMFVISHRDEIKDSFKDQIVVELKNGFSSIKTGGLVTTS